MRNLSEEIINKYLTGQCSEEELIEVNAWISESDENARQLFRMEEIYHLGKFDHYADEQRMANAEKRLYKQLSQEKKKKDKVLHMHRWMRYAAILAVALLMGGGAGYWFYNRPEHQMLVAVANEGIVKEVVLPDGTTWTPRNSTDKREGEMVTLKWGLANSVNNISGWVLKQFTPEAVVQMAHRMGITSFIDPVPAIFLGSSEVSVKEMVGAFSIYANKGVYNAPMMVTKIEDKYGNVLANFYPESREVITENTAFLMANLLQGVVDEGTGRRLRFRYGFKNQIGGKTGTTQNHSDGWFIGITPDLAGGVWVGAEDRSIHFQNLANGQGASMALPIWALFMQKVYADKSLAVPQSDFQKPNGVNHVLDCGDADREGMTDYDSSDEIFD